MFAIGLEPDTGSATRVRWHPSPSIHPGRRWRSATCAISACTGLLQPASMMRRKLDNSAAPVLTSRQR
jgi:hypothetical protein